MFLGLGQWLCLTLLLVAFGTEATKSKIHFKVVSGFYWVREVVRFDASLNFFGTGAT
jgi:hypothetical protein